MSAAAEPSRASRKSPGSHNAANAATSGAAKLVPSKPGTSSITMSSNSDWSNDGSPNVSCVCPSCDANATELKPHASDIGLTAGHSSLSASLPAAANTSGGSGGKSSSARQISQPVTHPDA